ncbi:MAG: dethiobiotin synthase [Thermodesulfovibrionales bacterium]|jgi:dethiobiotin synthetase
MVHGAKGFFVTGTDTGVGKTIITAALIKVISRPGFTTGGMKPIESGCLQQGDVLVPSDGMFIKTIAHMEENIRHITPCSFKSPLAPLPASEIEGLSVDLGKIRKAYDYLSARYEAVVVEGIGGLLVPITKNYFVIDMAKDFNLPLIVVSRPSLGTINHTMLTVNYAIKEGLRVAGIIINYSQPPENTLAETTNPEIIKQISPVPVIGIFPYLTDMESATIKEAAEKNLDIELVSAFLQPQ